jgi:hypothetical protein
MGHSPARSTCGVSSKRRVARVAKKFGSRGTVSCTYARAESRRRFCASASGGASAGISLLGGSRTADSSARSSSATAACVCSEKAVSRRWSVCGVSRSVSWKSLSWRARSMSLRFFAAAEERVCSSWLTLTRCAARAGNAARITNWRMSSLRMEHAPDSGRQPEPKGQQAYKKAR